MNRPLFIRWLLIAGSAGSIMVATSVPAAEQDADGFVSIFDGKTLHGWEVMPARAAQDWTVRDGMIVGEDGQVRSHLVFENRRLADF